MGHGSKVVAAYPKIQFDASESSVKLVYKWDGAREKLGVTHELETMIYRILGGLSELVYSRSFEGP